jgi:hypothetical protein
MHGRRRRARAQERGDLAAGRRQGRDLLQRIDRLDPRQRLGICVQVAASTATPPEPAAL